MTAATILVPVQPGRRTEEHIRDTQQPVQGESHQQINLGRQLATVHSQKATSWSLDALFHTHIAIVDTNQHGWQARTARRAATVLPA